MSEDRKEKKEVKERIRKRKIERDRQRKDISERIKAVEKYESIKGRVYLLFLILFTVMKEVVCDKCFDFS